MGLWKMLYGHAFQATTQHLDGRDTQKIIYKALHGIHVGAIPTVLGLFGTLQTLFTIHTSFTRPHTCFPPRYLAYHSSFH